MGFGKFLKDRINDVNEFRDEKKEQKRREHLQEYQHTEDIAQGKFCRICMKRGVYENQCTKCKNYPICDADVKSNNTCGTVCRNCWDDYLCNAQSCPSLYDEWCLCCGRQVCGNHRLALFDVKGQFFVCTRHEGQLVCRHCVERGQEGTFRKHHYCIRCKKEGILNELHPRSVH